MASSRIVIIDLIDPFYMSTLFSLDIITILFVPRHLYTYRPSCDRAEFLKKSPILAQLSPWKKQLLWPSARIKWILTTRSHPQNKQGKSDWLNFLINDMSLMTRFSQSDFPCLFCGWDVVVNFHGKFYFCFILAECQLLLSIPDRSVY